MGTSIESCSVVVQARGEQNNLRKATADLNDAKREVDQATADRPGFWRFGGGERKYQEAKTKFDSAASRFENAKSRLEQQESKLLATGDVALSQLINKRRTLSAMLDTLGAIRTKAGAAAKAQSRVDTSSIAAKVHGQTVAESLPSAFHGAPNSTASVIAQTAAQAEKRNKAAVETATAQVNELHAAMTSLANQFNQQAKSLGLATFNSSSAQGLGQDVDGLTTKISGELKTTMDKLNAEYESRPACK